MKQKIIDFWKNSAILSQITKAENRYFRRRVGRLSAAQLERLERVPCANLALLTSHKDRTQPYAHYIKPDYGRPYPLVYMNRDALGLNGFERHFDFVGFLNHRNEPKEKSIDRK